jgi:glycosyltransferase involved in cell wall biosynthesis
MIVKNEEKYLPLCLNSIKDIVDEIIIVDTGSTDKTVNIANEFGARVYFYQWTNNFSEARNESLKYATKDWILIMDGDDEFCNEDYAKFKELLNSSLDENKIYFFETLNYSGTTIDDYNISVNLNPRLFRNNHGFHYEGAIHNQLVNSEFMVQDISYPIRIYHYGYLEDTMASKNKRARNIPLLEEQLKQNPENRYAHFNLANEFYSLNELSKSLEHYYKAYENFDPNSGYGFILIARIVVTNYALGNYDKAIEYADIGIRYFPNFTDLYYLKAIVYNQCNKPTLEIKALEYCLKLGEPPSELKFLYGTGSYKAYYGLGNAYMKLKDFDTAYNYYIETIKSKHDFIMPVYNIGHLLHEKNTPLAEYKSLMESFFTDYPNAYIILADIFYIEGYYEIALEYIIKGESISKNSENFILLKARTLVRIGKLDDYIKLTFTNLSNTSYIILSMYKVLCYILTNKFEPADSLINDCSNRALSKYDENLLKVYTQLVKLFSKEEVTVLSHDENNKDYTPIIFEICEILLINRRFDEFETALGLLNLIGDKSILLHLGKLYYKYGYIAMAKKEILRSIKEFEIFDSEGLDILRC